MKTYYGFNEVKLDTKVKKLQFCLKTTLIFLELAICKTKTFHASGYHFS